MTMESATALTRQREAAPRRRERQGGSQPTKPGVIHRRSIPAGPRILARPGARDRRGVDSRSGSARSIHVVYSGWKGGIGKKPGPGGGPSRPRSASSVLDPIIATTKRARGRTGLHPEDTRHHLTGLLPSSIRAQAFQRGGNYGAWPEVPDRLGTRPRPSPRHADAARRSACEIEFPPLPGPRPRWVGPVTARRARERVRSSGPAPAGPRSPSADGTPPMARALWTAASRPFADPVARLAPRSRPLPRTDEV